MGGVAFAPPVRVVSGWPRQVIPERLAGLPWGLEMTDVLVNDFLAIPVRQIMDVPAQDEWQPPVSTDLTPLVQAAIGGDQRAVDRVLATVRPLVLRYCRARVGRQERSYASADDVAQDVCLAVLTALPTYRDQGRPFLAFVYGIAAHKVADARRVAARNRIDPVAEVPDAPEAQAGPEQRAIHQEMAGELGELLGQLSDTQRDILILRVIVGLSAEETARIVGSTPGAVRVAQHRALSRLRADIVRNRRHLQQD